MKMTARRLNNINNKLDMLVDKDINIKCYVDFKDDNTYNFIFKLFSHNKEIKQIKALNNTFNSLYKSLQDKYKTTIDLDLSTLNEQQLRILANEV